jgi:hypothetical protein
MVARTAMGRLRCGIQKQGMHRIAESVLQDIEKDTVDFQFQLR